MPRWRTSHILFRKLSIIAQATIKAPMLHREAFAAQGQSQHTSENTIEEGSQSLRIPCCIIITYKISQFKGPSLFNQVKLITPRLSAMERLL